MGNASRALMLVDCAFQAHSRRQGYLAYFKEQPQTVLLLGETLECMDIAIPYHTPEGADGTKDMDSLQGRMFPLFYSSQKFIRYHCSTTSSRIT